MPYPPETRERFQQDPEDSRHGTVNGYINLRCRCDRCLAAGRTFSSEAAKAKKERGEIPEDAHGTYNGYTNYGCRCDACIGARADRTAAYKAAEVAKLIKADVTEGLRQHRERKAEAAKIIKETVMEKSDMNTHRETSSEPIGVGRLVYGLPRDGSIATMILNHPAQHFEGLSDRDVIVVWAELRAALLMAEKAMKERGISL